MPFFPKVGGLGTILAPSWGVLGPYWLQVRGSWDHVASKLGGLGSKLSLLGSKLGVKLALKLHFANIAKNIEKSMIFIVFSMFFEGRGVPSWHQNP